MTKHQPYVIKYFAVLDIEPSLTPSKDDIRNSLFFNNKPYLTNLELIKVPDGSGEIGSDTLYERLYNSF